MATYALTVSTGALGIGVIDGARVVVDRRRTQVTDVFNGQSLSKNSVATNSSGIATILLEPDDGSVYHELKIFDLAGILVYSKIFIMPPQAVAVTALPVQDIISSSATQAVAASVTATEQSVIATAQAVIATEKSVLTAADRVQTGLDVIATAADRVQTGLDAAATAGSAAEATAQAVISTDQATLSTAAKVAAETARDAVLGVSGGGKAYLTLSSLNSSGAPSPVTQLAFVTNDGTTANNGMYAWNGSVWVKSAYDPLVQSKTYTDQFVNNTATITATANATIYSSATNTLTIAATTLSINTIRESFTVPTQTISMPVLSGAYLIVYDRPTTTVSFKLNSSRVATDYILGYMQYILGSQPIFTFTYPYTHNGLVIKPFNNRLATTVNTDAAQVNIDLSAKTVTILGSSLRIVSVNLNVVIPATTLTLPDTLGTYTLEYDALTQVVSISSTATTKTDSSVVFATLIRFSTYAQIFGIPYYSINNLAFTPATYGYLYTATVGSLNLDTVTNVLTTAASGRVLWGTGFKTLPVSSTALPVVNGSYRVEINLLTNVISIPLFSDPQLPMTVCFARLKLTASGYVLYGADTYGINGSVPSSGGGGITDSKPNYGLAVTIPNSINFDFDHNKISITSGIFISYNGTRISVPAQVVTLDPARVKGFAYIIAVNPTTSIVSVISQAAPYIVPTNYVIIGAYYELSLTVFGFSKYLINGLSPDTFAVKTSFGWSTDNEVSVNVADSFKSSDALPYTSITSTVVYDWFDDLVTRYPAYVTRTLLGMDQSGTLPIYQYRFKPKFATSVSAPTKPKYPKVMITVVHSELMNSIYVRTLMREICDSWQASEALTSLRHGVEFVVIPCGNPWSLDNGVRTNSRGVDINRNYPIDWQLVGVFGDVNYSGASALSEAETQVIYNSMVAEKPDIFYDCHSFGAADINGKSLWVGVLNQITLESTSKALNKIYGQYKKKYPWLVDANYLTDITNEASFVPGGIASRAGAALGAIGGTFETSWSLLNQPSGAACDNTAINFAVDALGTLILKSIDTLIKLGR